ncbi:MAG: amino-acid N-acetyltransferase [Treponema sp.]|nr:amino-acid N-acetyltransferase [Treponema sp.]
MTTSKKADSVRDVIRYLQKFKNATLAIYLDDKTISSSLFSSHIRDIAMLHQAGLKVVLIPGARRRIDEILKNAGIKWTYQNNFRVTSQEAMPLIKMAAFDVSNIVMTSLAANGITAVIGNWVRARGRGVLNGFDYGTAGEIDKLETDAIRTVLNDGFIPIFPCIGWNAAGHPYNISSMLLAKQVAINLQADKLFFMMFDEEINSQNFIIPEGFALSEAGTIPAMNLEEVEAFLEKNSSADNDIRNLMKASEEACRSGVTRVHIVNGNMDGVLPCEIFSGLGSGTMIYTSNYGKVRPMVQTDIPSVLSIMRPFVESGKLLPRTEEQISASLEDFIVYELDGGVHACAAIHFYDDGQAEIAAVAVDENYAHMGIGPKLIDNLISQAGVGQASSVFIMTTQAADWFETLGFEEDDIDSIPDERRKLWSRERNSKVYRLKK